MWNIAEIIFGYNTAEIIYGNMYLYLAVLDITTYVTNCLFKINNLIRNQQRTSEIRGFLEIKMMRILLK